MFLIPLGVSFFIVSQISLYAYLQLNQRFSFSIVFIAYNLYGVTFQTHNIAQQFAKYPYFVAEYVYIL